MFNVTSIRAPRPAVDWFSTSEGVERAPEEPTLPADRVSLSPEARRELRRQQGPGGAAPAADLERLVVRAPEAEPFR